jgi:FtsP/CotA-like multicopper oxidase with cupredoxin domain
VDRRDFLKFSGAGLASSVAGAGMISWAPRSEAATISKTFYISDGSVTMPDGVSVYLQTFSDAAGTLNYPASSISCQEGDTLSITVYNNLTTTHNFVIGGLKQGDPPLASTGNIPSGGHATLTYTIPTGQGKAGTYLFYDNYKSYNRYLGLHGCLIVMPYGISNQVYAGSPTFVQQQYWIFNDIDPAINSAVQNGTTPPSTPVPRYFTINGLTSLPPGAPGFDVAGEDAMATPGTKLVGSIGDRTLIRVLNVGPCSHSMHTHANHMEWLTYNGTIRPDVWLKDIIYMRNNMGKADVIYPFEMPPDSYPPETTGQFPMHIHDEMSQTCGGGLYLFGAMTDIYFV